MNKQCNISCLPVECFAAHILLCHSLTLDICSGRSPWMPSVPCVSLQMLAPTWHLLHLELYRTGDLDNYGKNSKLTIPSLRSRNKTFTVSLLFIFNLHRLIWERHVLLWPHLTQAIRHSLEHCIQKYLIRSYWGGKACCRVNWYYGHLLRKVTWQVLFDVTSHLEALVSILIPLCASLPSLWIPKWSIALLMHKGKSEKRNKVTHGKESLSFSPFPPHRRS